MVLPVHPMQAVMAPGFGDGPLGGQWRLLQRTIDRGELAVELGAKPVHDRDDGKRDASCDQPILDGGCAGFVGEEFA
jgi:hypothetical protein